MKCTLVFLTLCAATVMAQTSTTHHPHMGGHSNELDILIRREVMALMASHPDLSVSNCVTKCDALFDLVTSRDEQATDALCTKECRTVIGHLHGNHAHSTTHTPN